MQGGGVPEGSMGLDPLGSGDAAQVPIEGAAVGGEEADVPVHLRNMLLYAQHLSEGNGVDAVRPAGSLDGGSAAGRSLLGHEDSDDEGIGCGFYDVFYEGCMPCFYTPMACQAEDMFYDFYRGPMAHAPITEYADSFADPSGDSFGERAERDDAMWGGDWIAATTPRGDVYLGGVGSGHSLTVAMNELPKNRATVTLSFDFVVDGEVADMDSPLEVTVLGEGGPLEATEMFRAPTHLLGVPHYQMEYIFPYFEESVKIKFRSVLQGNGTWGLDNILVTSLIDNYAPVVEDREAYTLPDQAVTVELRGHDNECEDMTYTVTTVPTGGTLYLCTCDNIWTTAITPEMLPMPVPGPCQRVVYAPTPNTPTPAAGRMVDDFHYVATDGKGATSNPARIRVYVEPDYADTPVAGVAGFAASFDGEDDVLSISRTPSTMSALTALTLEARFKSTGDVPRGTLIHRDGVFTLGWTAAGGLGCSVTTVRGTYSVMSMTKFDNSLWHHALATYDGATLSLYVDARVVASETFAPATLNSTDAAPVVGAGEEYDQVYAGMIDEVRIWGASVGQERVLELYQGWPAVTGNETGLIVYLHFNDGRAASPFVFDKSPLRNDGHLGVLGEDGYTDGVATRYPTFVASTAAFGNVEETIEDMPVTVSLHGGDGEGGVTFVIATLPLEGFLLADLSSAGGPKMANITSSPYPLYNVSTVTYVPAPNGNGAPYDIFKYQTYDGHELSYRQGVLINVHPVNDIPEAFPQTVVITADDMMQGAKLVKLGGEDVDGDDITFRITTLPTTGLIWQVDSNLIMADPIDELGTRVNHDSGYILYTPLVNGRDGPDGSPYDHFGFEAHDGMVSSNEASITVRIPEDSMIRPASGDAGYCLYFDGCQNEATLGNTSSFFTGATGASVEAWFKTSALAAETDMTLVSARPLVLRFTKVLGLQFVAGDAVAPTMSFFNDGLWHYVSGTYDGESACVSVDGGNQTCVPAMVDLLVHRNTTGYNKITAGAPIMVGTDEDRNPENYYHGFVDEVAIFDYARNVSTVAADMHLDLTGVNYQYGDYFWSNGTYEEVDEPEYIERAPKGYFTFNEACGVDFTNSMTGAITMNGRGFHGMDGTEPKWVPSTVSVGDNAWVKEDTETVVELSVTSEDCQKYEACLVTPPKHGQLYMVYADGTRSEPLPGRYQLPAPVNGTRIIYKSDVNVNGAEVDSFKYFGGDCELWWYGMDLASNLFYSQTGEIDFIKQSMTTTVTIDVQPMNHPPTACASAHDCLVSLNYGEHDDVEMTLPANDDDEDFLYVTITHLPTKGVLRSWDGKPLGTAGVFVPAQMDGGKRVFKVVYTPLVNGKGMPFDDFGYVVSDGARVTAEQLVMVNVEDTGLLTPYPVAGDSGMAMFFDGDGDVVTLPSDVPNCTGTVGMFFKTSAEVQNGETALAYMGEMTLAWGLLDGLTLSVGDFSVKSGESFNDGVWHYVAAQFDGRMIGLMVDGVSYGNVTTEGFMCDFNRTNTTNMGYIGSDGESPTCFRGFVDELAIFEGARAAYMTHVMYEERTTFNATEAGLLAYYRFNEASGTTVVSEVDGTDGTMGMDGLPASYPTRVASTVYDFGAYMNLMEDTNATLVLGGVANFDLTPSFRLVRAPHHGIIWANGKVIHQGSMIWNASSVIYKPNEHYVGMDEFTYVVEDNKVESTPRTYGLKIHHVNDRPTAEDVVEVVDYSSPDFIRVQLTGHDSDVDSLRYMLTYLPYRGTLYQAVLDGIPQGRLAVGMNVTRVMYYQPTLNAAENVDYFGYVVIDETDLISAEATVTFDGTEAAMSDLKVLDTPVAGTAGLALEFDGISQRATFPTLGAMGVADSGVLVVSLWFKTGLTTLSDMTLLAAGPFKLAIDKVNGLFFTAGDASVATMMPFNDGLWHNVEVEYDMDGAVGVTVDAASVNQTTVNATGMVAPVEIDSDAPVYLGGDGETFFCGQIDELEVATMGHYALYHMNEPLGNALLASPQYSYSVMDADLAGSLGEDGMNEARRVVSSAPVMRKTVVTEEDSSVTFTLEGVVTDEEAVPVFTITALPARGTLYYLAQRADGPVPREIREAPFTLANATLVFVPTADEAPLDDGTVYTTIKYKAHHAMQEGLESYETTVDVVVLPINDRPVLDLHGQSEVYVAENSVADIDLRGTGFDVETPEEDLVYRIVTLPHKGQLWISNGTLLTGPTELNYTDTLKLTYMPPPNSKGAPYSSFGVVVFDGELVSQEATVSLNVAGNQALYFDGSAMITVTEDPAQLSGEFTVEAWMKTSATMEGIYTVIDTAYTTLALTMDVDPAYFMTGLVWPLTLTKVNEVALTSSRWQHVAATFGDNGKNLYVDGILVATQAAMLATKPGDESVLTIGASPALEGSTMWTGILDEVRVWGRALEHFVLLDNAKKSMTGSEEGLVAYWSFDELVDGGASWRNYVIDSAKAACGADSFLDMAVNVVAIKYHAPTVAGTSSRDLAASPLMAGYIGGSAGYGLQLDGHDDALTADISTGGGTFSLEAWFKTGQSSASQSTLLSYGKAAVRWCKITGLGFQLGDAVAESMNWYNDGAWHHVSAVVRYIPSGINYPEPVEGSYALDLFIDAERVASTVSRISTNQEIGTLGDNFQVGKPVDPEYSFFAGAIDEVKVWALARTPTMMEDRFMVAKPAPGLIAYYDLNEANGDVAGDKSGTGNDAAVEGGRFAPERSWVVSSAPVDVPATSVNEDQPVALVLSGQDADADELAITLTRLPSDGTIEVDGMILSEEDIPIKVGTDEVTVVYMPPANWFGTASFQYTVFDGYYTSRPAAVVVEVVPLNDRPSLAFDETVMAQANVPAVVELKGASDVDGDALVYAVTTLPVVGELYQYSEDAPTKVGAPILVPGSAVTDGHNRVVYMSGVNSEGEDVFGFHASDGALASPEAMVVVDVGAGPVVPTAGPAGYALSFAGAGVSFEAASPVPTEVVMGPGVTIEFWTRTSMAITDDPITLLYLDPAEVTLTLTRVAVEASFGDIVVASTKPINDGLWHHIAMTFVGTEEETAMVLIVDDEAVDGTLPGVNTTDPTPMVTAFGVGNHFFGLVDELRVWPRAMDAHEVAEKSTVLVTESEGLHLYYPFDTYPMSATAVTDVVSGVSVEMSEGPVALEGSTVPVSTYEYLTDEESPVEISLVGTGESSLQFHIVSLPEKGSLLGNDGAPITYVPYVMEAPMVTFVPEPHTFGYPYASFGYMTATDRTAHRDNSLGEFRVVTYVDPVYHVPSAHPVAPVSVETFGRVEIEMSAMDVDIVSGMSDNATLVITTLPQYGRLFQADGTPIRVGGTVVDGLEVDAKSGVYTGMVVYLPEDNVYSVPPVLTYDTYFAFMATDDVGVSNEVVVPVSVVQPTSPLTLPKSLGISTVAGRAVEFDGLADHMVFENAESLNAATDLTVELWMRSNAAVREDATLLAKPGMYGFRWQQLGGLVFEVMGAATDASGQLSISVGCEGMPCDLNDGYWHHVTGTFSAEDEEVTLYVDGMRMGSSSYPQPGFFRGINANVSSLVLANDGSADPDKFYNGLVDER